MNRIIACTCLVVGVLLCPLGSAYGEMVGTAFTYQGHLIVDGRPADGEYDFQFRLYDALIGGNEVCDVIPDVENKQVNHGLFTVTLNAGEGCFMTDARWLEIRVRPAGVGDYTPLAPRQKLTPVPYALALPGLWTEQNATSPNLIGGYSGNSVTTGAVGATIGGGGEDGSTNRVTDRYGTVGGGRNNLAGDGDDISSNAVYATVAGGYHNEATGNGAAIGGGEDNTASGQRATVGGGDNNTAGGTSATIGGGYENTAGSNCATVGGGYQNIASHIYSTVSGGNRNTAINEYTTVGGGIFNVASAWYSTVPGGRSNIADGRYSFAAGQRAKSMHEGTFVWADSTDADFTSTAPQQFLVRASGGVGIGTNDPQAQLHVGGTPGVDGIMFPDGTLQTTAAAGGFWTPDGDDLFYAEGGVGIGTEGPLFDAGDTLVTKSATLPTGRRSMGCATAPATGKIYCLGGWDSGPGYLDEILEYDPGSDTLVTKTATLPSGLMRTGCAADPLSGNIYCFGGRWQGGGFSDDIIEYNPDTDTVAVMTATLPSGMESVACVASPTTGRIYCLGGGTGMWAVDTILEYEPATDNLETMTATLPSRRYGMGVATSPLTGKIYCFGGQEEGAGALDEIVEYDPGTDTLVTMTATLPSSRYGMTCAADPASGRIYCFAGRTEIDYLDEIVEYDPDSDTIITTTATLPSARARAGSAASAITGKIYYFGGLDPDYLDEILEYAPPVPTLLQVGDPGDGTRAVANSWDVFSSRAFKRDIAPLGPADYLDILAKLRVTDVVRYRYAHDAQRRRHLGVIAEDSPPEILGLAGKTVSLADYNAFLMAAIKAQQAMIEEKECQIADVQTQLTETQARLTRLEALVTKSAKKDDGGAR